MNNSYNPHLGYEADVLTNSIGMVHKIAGKYRVAVGAGFDYEDIVSEGTLGMLEAFRRYDPDRFDGRVNSFSTYAIPWIRGHIQRFIRDKRYTVRVPRRIYDKANVIRNNGWTDESATAISDKTGWGLLEVTDILSHMNGWSIKSLDQVVTNNIDDTDMTLYDVLPSESDLSRVDVMNFMDVLSPKEKRLVELLLIGAKQKEIAAELGITRTYINRFLKRVQDKYIQFQAGELAKEDLNMSNAIENAKSSLSKIEWFIDSTVPTMPSVNVNSQGIYLNKHAVNELGCKAGQFLSIGFDSAVNRLVIRIDNHGLKLRKVNGDCGLRLVNKGFGDWLRKKQITPKRYSLQRDRLQPVFFIELDHHD